MSPRYSIVPGSASYDTRLTDFDYRVLGCIGRHTDGQGWCSISQTKLANALGKTREAVNRAVKHLCKLGYLQKHDYRSAEHGPKRQNICVYRVLMDTAPAPEAPMPENDLVIPGSLPLVTPQSQTLVTGGSQHNDLSFSSSQRDIDLKSAEQDCSGPCKKYATQLSRGAAPTVEEDFREFAMGIKSLDVNSLMAGGVLYNPKGYAKLGELMDQFGAPVFEQAVREVIARELRDGKMRRGGIRCWSYFAGQAADIAKRLASGGMPIVEECAF
jgi:hypothetical protein